MRELTPNEQQKELIKITNGIKGFIYFLITYVMIEGLVKKADGSVKKEKTLFKLWKWQVKFIVKALFTKKKIVLGKARQMGGSTVCLAYILWKSRFIPDTKALLLSETEDGAIELLRKIKYMYNELPDWLKTSDLTDNETLLGFNEIGSFIKARASTEGAGSGFTFDIVLFDEASKHLFAEKAYASVKPTVEWGQIVCISTPNGSIGRGKFYYSLFTEAKNRTSSFHLIELPWWLHPYRVNSDRGKEIVLNYIENNIRPNKEEEDYLKTEPWYIEEMNSYVSNNKGGKSSKLLFKQEYEMYFLATGDPVFDLDFIFKNTEKEKPLRGHQYVIGLDPSQGNGGDYAVAQVLDITDLNNIKQVNTLRSNQIAPDLFAIKVIQLSIDYNVAPILMEVKDKASGIMLTTFRHRNYGQHLLHDTNGKVGFETNHYNKTDIINELNIALRDGIIKLSDEDTITELMNYVYTEKGTMEGLENDDTVMSLAIALYGIKLKNRRVVIGARGNV